MGLSFIWDVVAGPLGAVLAGIIAIAGAFLAGKRNASQKAKIKGLEADKKANERIDHADISSGDVDADTEWLSGRAKK